MLQEAVGSVSSASRLGAVMVGSDHGGPGQLPTAKESFGRELFPQVLQLSKSSHSQMIPGEITHVLNFM